MKPVDLRLNAIVDPERAGGRDPADLARLCAQGGATLIQLRDKSSDTRAMVGLRGRSKRRWRRSRAVRRQRSRRRGARRRCRRRACRPGRHGVEDARGCSGRDAIIGVSVRSGTRSRSGAGRGDRLRRRRRRLRRPCRKQPKIRRSVREGFSRIIAALHGRAPNCRIAASPASTPAMPPR